MGAIPLAKISWKPCWRIIPSRYPPVDIFEGIAPASDWETLFDIETLTNERIRQEKGEVSYVNPEDEVTAPGSSLIMAPFTHPDPNGDWFSDGSFGVCYTASSLEVALECSMRRREEFLQRTKEGPMLLQMRVLNMDLDGTFHDLRGKRAVKEIDLEASRELGRLLREQGSFGLICEDPFSVSGPTVAVFRHTVLTNCRQERHLAYKWDGRRIVQVYDYSTGEVIRGA